MSKIQPWQAPVVSTAGAAPDGTRIDTVELLVKDLDGLSSFYQDAVTLEILDQAGDTVTLGHGGVPSMKLRHAKDLPARNQRGAGLYHTALLFSDEQRLATALMSMAQKAPQFYEGSADHLVSEAFYFHDPEGNGIELYHDRDRAEWNFGHGAEVVMGAEPLDPNAFLQKWYDPQRPVSPKSAVVGHIHLQVGDIQTARNFYETQLGFDVTASMPSALFLSAGGYHHHIGMNVWNSAGAGPRAATLGLGDVRLLVPEADDVFEIADRLKFHKVSSSHDGKTLRLADPWGTQITISPEQ